MDKAVRHCGCSYRCDQEKHVTKEERTAWNAKLDEAKRGKAGGVASLDAQGKVPAGQLPEMNYDPAGSAQAVQQKLNTHAANKTLHVTDAERQAWNSKAPGTHTHTAVQVGALPISGGTMTGALNMNGKALTNLPTPTNNKDAAPKDYVDKLLSSIPNVQVVTGTYTGNGKPSQNINLGFKPKIVFVRANDFLYLESSGGNYSLISFFEYAISGGSSMYGGNLKITSTGFTAYIGTEDSDSRLNMSSTKYNYFAIK